MPWPQARIWLSTTLERPSPQSVTQRFALAGCALACGPDCPNLLGAWAEFRVDWLFLWEALHLACYFGAKQVRQCALPRRKNDRCTIATSSGRTCCASALRGPPAPEALTRGKHASLLCMIPSFSIWRCMFDLMHALEPGLLQRRILAATQGKLGLPEGELPGQPEPRHSVAKWLRLHTCNGIATPKCRHA